MRYEERPAFVEPNSADPISSSFHQATVTASEAANCAVLTSFARTPQEAFAASWRGAAEVDGFNALVLKAGLDWRQAAILRAYAKYLRQATTPYSQDYIEDAVLAHTAIATALVALFETRFNPVLAEADRLARAELLTTEITEMIDEVTSLDSDRILRSLLGLINATLRTNFYVNDGDEPKPYLAVNLCAGNGHSVREILETLLKVDGYRDADVRFDASRPSTIPVRLMENRLAKDLLGFEARTTLDEGLRRTLAWYRANKT